MKITDCYNLEKTKAKSAKLGEIIEGFEVIYVDLKDGIILVDADCKECGQTLKLFEALGYGDLCENCL